VLPERERARQYLRGEQSAGDRPRDEQSRIGIARERADHVHERAEHDRHYGVARDGDAMITISDLATFAFFGDSDAMMPSRIPVPNIPGRRETCVPSRKP